MPLRQTIGISLALLVMSAGAMAETLEQDAAHHSSHPPGSKPETAERTKKVHKPSHKVVHAVAPTRLAAHRAGRVRYRHAAAYRVADASANSLDPYAAPMHATGPREIGEAAWYGLVGHYTSSGELLDSVTPTAAHRSLPLASYAKVTDLESGRSVIVKINDRGPYNRRFIIDLSPRAADELDMRHAGTASVLVEPVAPEVVPTVATYRSSGADTVQ